MTINTSMSHEAPSIETLRFLGGRLCLDFTNTLDPRMGDQRHDFLTSYAELVKWGQRAAAVTEEEAQHLREKARLHSTNATATLEQAIVLREVIYSIFSMVARGVLPQENDLQALQSAFVAAMTHACIVGTPEGFTWHWFGQEKLMDSMLWPVIRSAVDLLTSEEVKRVKQCPGLGDCGWLFLDTSKNGSRQWCSMDGCGSRAKMRQFYARKRASGSRKSD